MPLLEWHVKSTTKAQQGLYEYDAVSRLRDSQLGDERVHDIANYIRRGKLWEAFTADERPVLLIDEIDKADIEFPNDLLQELDRMEFYVYETGETIRARNRPIVIITSNNEKELPDAFLRRCFFHYIRFPDRRDDAGDRRRPLPRHQEAAAAARRCRVFYDIREVPGLKKKPSTSELLDWIKLLLAEDIDADVLRERDPEEADPAAAWRAAQERAGRPPVRTPRLHGAARRQLTPAGADTAEVVALLFRGLRICQPARSNPRRLRRIDWTLPLIGYDAPAPAKAGSDRAPGQGEAQRRMTGTCDGGRDRDLDRSRRRTNDRNGQMKIKLATIACAALVSFGMAARGLGPDPGGLRPYARDYAKQVSNGTEVLGGAAVGAVGGAIIGGIIGGGKGAGTGALIGGGTGAVGGAATHGQRYQDAYNYAYYNCMNQAPPSRPRAVLQPWTPAWYQYCSSKYRSFNPQTGYFTAYSGRRSSASRPAETAPGMADPACRSAGVRVDACPSTRLHSTQLRPRRFACT